MKIRNYFFEAQKIMFRKRALVGFLYLATIFFAIVMTLPMAASLEALATTALSEYMIDGFFIDYFADYWQHYAPAFATAARFIVAFALFYILLNTFFTGGIFAILFSEPAFSFREFFYASASFFGRNFRLFLLSLPMLLLFALGFVLAIFTPLARLSEGMAPDTANLVFVLSLIAGVFVLCFWNMLFDYGKIVIYAHNRKSAVAGFFHAVGFVFKNLSKSIRLYLLSFVIVCLLFVVYFSIEGAIANDTIAHTYFLLALQQMFIIARLWMRVTFFASQYRFYTYVPEAKTAALRELFASPSSG